MNTTLYIYQKKEIDNINHKDIEQGSNTLEQDDDYYLNTLIV
jgi:hypothetical protein